MRQKYVCVLQHNLMHAPHCVTCGGNATTHTAGGINIIDVGFIMISMKCCNRVIICLEYSWDFCHIFFIVCLLSRFSCFVYQVLGLLLHALVFFGHLAHLVNKIMVVLILAQSPMNAGLITFYCLTHDSNIYHKGDDWEI